VRIPILTYQPTRIDGIDYRNNDLHALASALRQVTQSGFRIVALRSIVDAWLDNRGGDLEGRVVALACDHGADFDYTDLPHPSAGTQRSVLNILRDFATANPGAQPALNVTSFVVASPEARAALDTACLLGKGWWTDGWWKAAIDSGLMHIANHSWDHNHDALPPSFSQGVRRGTFLNITSERLADHEIRLVQMLGEPDGVDDGLHSAATISSSVAIAGRSSRRASPAAAWGNSASARGS